MSSQRATASSIRKHGQIIGENCRALGFNVDFAPVLDLAFEASRTSDEFARRVGRSARNEFHMLANFSPDCGPRKCWDAANISLGSAKANSTAIMSYP